MSASVTNIAIREFDTYVKEAYQSHGKMLDKTVRFRGGFEGSSVQFPKVDLVTSVQVGFLDALTLQDPNFTNVICNLNKWVAPTGVDDVQQITTNVDVRRELSMIVGYASARRRDQLVINAMVNSGTTNIIDDTFGVETGTSNLNYAKMRQIAYYFDYNAVPPEDRFLLIGASQGQDLMNQEQFTNNLYSNAAMNAVNDGSLNASKSMGMNIIVIPNMPNEGGLPLSGTVRSCFAYARNSAGFAMNKMEARIDWLPHTLTWQVASIMYAGAVAVDPVGIIEIQCDESATMDLGFRQTKEDKLTSALENIAALLQQRAA